jgi:hypothetical protein
MKQPEHTSQTGRRQYLIYTFSAALLAGLALAVGVGAFAQSGEEKRKPIRDNQTAVQPSDLPPGEQLDVLTAPRLHGRILVYPPGMDPTVTPPADSTVDVRYTRHQGVDAASRAGLVVSPDAIPAGYSIAGGSALEVHRPDGTSEFVESGLSIEGTGYPIHVFRSKPWQHYADQPYAVPAWLEGNVMTTLGEVGGVPAVFVHKRLDVKTAELQQVFIDDGDRVILVEGYVDEFSKLIRIAESILQNAKKGN